MSQDKTDINRQRLHMDIEILIRNYLENKVRCKIVHYLSEELDKLKNYNHVDSSYLNKMSTMIMNMVKEYMTVREEAVLEELHNDFITNE